MSSLKHKSREGFEELYQMYAQNDMKVQKENFPDYSKIIKVLQAQANFDISEKDVMLFEKLVKVGKLHGNRTIKISQKCVDRMEDINRKYDGEIRLRKMESVEAERDQKLDDAEADFMKFRKDKETVLANESQKIQKLCDENIQKLIREAQKHGITVDAQGVVTEIATETLIEETETSKSTELDYTLMMGNMDELDLFDDSSTVGIDKIQKLQKLLSEELNVDFSDAGKSFDLPKNNELTVVKLNELSRNLKHISEELVGVETYVMQVRENIDMAEEARKEWKKRIKKAQKAYDKIQDDHSAEVILFLKKDAERMVEFIDTVIEKENKKVYEAMNTLRTFHLVDYKIKASIFEETKHFMFNSVSDPAKNARLEHAQFSNSLNIILERLEPTIKKEIKS